MKLFFDESGYSGCVMPNKNGSLYNDGQRHFVLGGVFVKDENDEHELLQKYCAFKNQFGFEGEVKGSDLMKRENNRALEFFITNILLMMKSAENSTMLFAFLGVRSIWY